MGRGAKQLRSRVVLVALVAMSFVQTATAAKRDLSGVITIVALGDSLTAGYGLSRKQAYPALVAEKMRAAGQEFEVINAGSSGDTTAGGCGGFQQFCGPTKKSTSSFSNSAL